MTADGHGRAVDAPRSTGFILAVHRFSSGACFRPENAGIRAIAGNKKCAISLGQKLPPKPSSSDSRKN
jgi:hypothetical protein